MNQETEERIRIIMQFKPTTYFKDQSLEGRIKKLKYYGILKYGLANFVLIIAIVLSAIALLTFDPSGQSWQKAGLLVFITMNLSLNAHYPYIEFLLLSHIKTLHGQDVMVDINSNKELKGLINHMDYNRFKPYWIIIPSLILIIASILSFFDLNPYWNMFALPVLIVSALLSWRLNNQVSLVQNNIEDFESKIVWNSIN